MFKYFKLEDFDCQQTGENEMEEEFIHKLDALREVCGFPFIITSGYRSPSHSLEIKKPNGGGYHTKGIAADVRITNSKDRHTIIKNAMKMGFTGIGIHRNFVHCDTRLDTARVWLY